jgi:hypothetical protein
MSEQERFARASITLRTTFGGPAALEFWERFAAVTAEGPKGAKAKAKKAPSEPPLQAAFEGAWGDAAKWADTKKGKVRQSAASGAWGQRVRAPPRTGLPCRVPPLSMSE